MKEIADNKAGTKMYVGSEAVICADADGKVLAHKPGSTKPAMFISGRKDVMVKVGLDSEIEAEKAAQDAKYAPIKAAKEAERRAMRRPAGPAGPAGEAGGPPREPGAWPGKPVPKKE